MVIGEGEKKKAYRKTRVDEVAERTNAELVNFRHGPFVEVKVPNPVKFDKVKIAKILFECDKIVSISVLKTHHISLMSGALKNMFGVIPIQDKRRHHWNDTVEEAIVDINLAKKADLTIIDGFIGEEGLAGGLRNDRPVHMDTLIAGSDPVAVDTVCSRIMGIDPTKVLHLKWAVEKSIGTMEKIEVRNLQISDVSRRFRTPIDHVNEIHNKIRIVDLSSCSGCHGRVATRTWSIKDEILKEPITIFVGEGDISPKKSGVNILIGNCTKAHMNKGVFIPGCPPTMAAIQKELEKFLKG